MARRDSDRAFTVIAGIVVFLFIVIIVAGSIALNLWIAGGDWHCAFSKEAAICAAIDRGNH